MAEEKMKTTLDRIEELIEGGQKEVLEKIANVETSLGQRIGVLEEGQKEILEKMKMVHTSLKNEIMVTATAVKETVKEEIRRVEDKIDEHMRLLAHVGV